MTRNRTMTTVAALFVGLVASMLLVSQGDGQTAKTVNIGWNYHMGNSPAAVAEEKGLFNKHGIEANVKSFASGPVVSRGLQTKELDIAYVGFLPTFHDLARGPGGHGGGQVQLRAGLDPGPEGFRRSTRSRT